jgi:predicted dehydrogenase
MTTPGELGIGIVGYGIMGKAHSYGYTLAPRVRRLPCHPRLRVISGRNKAAAALVAQSYGFDRVKSDWRELIGAPDVDVVDICTPPGTHAEIIEAAAQAGKAILCEKPLAADYADAVRAVNLVQRSGVRNAIGFNYRRFRALSLMKQMIDEGHVGDVRLWRACWLSDEFMDPEMPFDWRFRRSEGSSTVADVGSHLIDLAIWMVGEIGSVCAQSGTFITARRNANGNAMHDVDADEASAALLHFSGGCLGILETARICPGHPCDFTVEVNGARGTLRFDYARLNELWYGSEDEPAELYGMRRIRVEHPSHPQTEGWWPLGQGIGYGESFVNQAADLLQQWPSGSWSPALGTGLEVQAVCEAIERAAEQRRWVEVREVTGQ